MGRAEGSIKRVAGEIRAVLGADRPDPGSHAAGGSTDASRLLISSSRRPCVARQTQSHDFGGPDCVRPLFSWEQGSQQRLAVRVQAADAVTDAVDLGTLLPKTHPGGLRGGWVFLVMNLRAGERSPEMG